MPLHCRRCLSILGYVEVFGCRAAWQSPWRSWRHPSWNTILGRHLSSPEMKRFLLTNSENKKWVEAQEKRHKAEQNVKDVSRLVRREMFLELHPEIVELDSAASSSFALKEARQRQLHRTLMKEFLKSFTTTGKQIIALYCTRTWEHESKAIFFHFHKSLGNMDQELTCSLFSIDVMTFQNWIKQKRYFCKWVHYVEAFKVSDILPNVLATYRKDYDDVTLQARCRSIQNFAIPLQVISTSLPYLPVLVKTIGKRPENLTTSHIFSKQPRLSILEEQWNTSSKKNSLSRLWWWNGRQATHWANRQPMICWSQRLVMNMKRNALNGRWRWRFIRRIYLQAFCNVSPEFLRDINFWFGRNQSPRQFLSIGYKFVWMRVPWSVASCDLLMWPVWSMRTKCFFSSTWKKPIWLLQRIYNELAPTELRMPRKSALWWCHARCSNFKSLPLWLPWLANLTARFQDDSLLGMGLAKSRSIQSIGWTNTLHLLGKFGVVLCRREGWFDLRCGF